MYGGVLTVTTAYTVDDAPHLPVTVTLYTDVSAGKTTIVGVDSPVFHRKEAESPCDTTAVSNVDSPRQIFVIPLMVTDGDRLSSTVILCNAVSEHPALSV